MLICEWCGDRVRNTEEAKYHCLELADEDYD